VIAIVPQIATSEMQATPSSSPAPSAGHAGEQSFSAIFEQANSSIGAQAKPVTGHAVDDQTGTTHIAPQESSPAISDLNNDTQAPTSSSRAIPADAEQSFSAALEQAKSFAGHSLGDQPAATQIASQGSYIPIARKSDSKSSNKTSDSKSADSKTSGSEAHGNSSAQAPASGLEPHDQTVSAVTVPILPLLTLALPALAWGEDIQNVMPDMHAGSALVGNAVNDHGVSSATTGIESTANANATSGTASLPAPSKDEAQAKPMEDTSSHDLPTAAGTKSTGGAASNAEAVASLVTKLSGVAASNSRMSAVNVPASAPAHNISRGTADTTDGASKTLAAVKSEIEQALVPTAGVSPAPVPPVVGSGGIDPGSSMGVTAEPASGKSKAGTTQVGVSQVGLNGEGLGTTTKNIDATGGAKSQTRKDDSQSSLSSATPDQTTVSAQAKTIDSSQAFSVSGTQTSPATGDSKTATAGVPHDASDPKAGQPEQTSTGVAQSQHGEIPAAYPTSQVHSAKLVERIGEAELRLGIRAGEFGSVDVRTSMIRNQFTAEISVERGELGRAMAAELPSLQNRLSEQRLPVANITLQNQTGDQSTASEQQKPRDGQRTYAMNPGSGREEGPMSALVAMEATATTSGLDIHM